MAPLISFLLPVRDGVDTLGAALDSLEAQTARDFEIIVVDDGSSDGSHTLFPGTLRQPPLGLVAALNRGLQACRGRFVARMDADDVAAPERLALQLPLLDTHAVVDGQVTLKDGGPGMQRWADWINAQQSAEDVDRSILVESPIVHPAATFHRQTVLDLGGYRDGPFPEDYDLWARLHAAGHRLCKVPTPLVTMWDREDRLTRTDPRYRWEGFRTVRQQWLRARFPRRRRVVFWGAGRECRPWVRWLVQHYDVVGIVDVDPRKVGGSRQDVPIVSPDAMPHADLCLVGVRAAGARAIIAARLAELRPGWLEGRDWFAVC